MRHHKPAEPGGSTCPVFCLFNDTATTEIYTLSLHDALPICWSGVEALQNAKARGRQERFEGIHFTSEEKPGEAGGPGGWDGGGRQPRVIGAQDRVGDRQDRLWGGGYTRRGRRPRQ